MFEPFSEEARKAIVLAQEEAVRMGVSYIGLEHLLLGIIALGSGVTAKAAAMLNLSLEYMRDEFRKHLKEKGKASKLKGDAQVFTEESKKVIELAFEEARALNHRYLGAEHLLLSITTFGDSIAWRTLQKKGVTPDMVRNSVYEALGVDPAMPGVKITAEGDSKEALEQIFESKIAGDPVKIPPKEGFPDSMRLAIIEAQRQGSSGIGTVDLLLGLIGEEWLADMIELKGLEIDSEKIRDEVRSLKGEEARIAQISSQAAAYTRRASIAIELAFEVAHAHRHGYVRGEHILSGILAMPECNAYQVLLKSGVNIDALKKGLSEVIEQGYPELLPAVEIVAATKDQRVRQFCELYRRWPLMQVRDMVSEVWRSDYFTFLITVCTTLDSLSRYWSGDAEEVEWSRIPRFLCSGYFDERWKTIVPNEEYDADSEHWYRKEPEITYAQRFYRNFHYPLKHFMRIERDALQLMPGEDYFDFNAGRTSHLLGIRPLKLSHDFVKGVRRFLSVLENSPEGSEVRERFHRIYEHLRASG